MQNGNQLVNKSVIRTVLNNKKKLKFNQQENSQIILNKTKLILKEILFILMVKMIIMWSNYHGTIKQDSDTRSEAYMKGTLFISV